MKNLEKKYNVTIEEKRCFSVLDNKWTAEYIISDLEGNEIGRANSLTVVKNLLEQRKIRMGA